MSEQEEKTRVNIHDYVQVLQKHKWIFLIAFVVVYAVFFVSSLFLPKVYEAKAVIVIEEKKTENPLLKNLAASVTVIERLNTLKEEILSWPRLFQLVERMKLDKKSKDPLSLERLIAGIRKNIALSMKSRDVMVISYRDRNALVTQELVNTLCSILSQRSLSSQMEDTESAIDFVNDQLAIYKKKLDESEAALRHFKEVYGSAQADVDSPAGATLNQVNSEISGLEAELVMASVDCTDEHPRIKDLKQRIQTLKGERDRYIKQSAQQAGIKPQAYVDIADSVPRQEEELARLTRDKAINEKVYAMFLERLESAKITERLDNSENRTKFKVIEPARLPLVPVKPNKLRINAIGLFLGLLLGAGMVYLFDYFDTSFKNAEKLKVFFDAPVLGSIAKITTREDQSRRILFRKRIYWFTGAAVILICVVAFIVIKMAF